MTHPRFGPFGARNGKTIPTTPHNAVKMMTGTTPIVLKVSFFEDRDEKRKFF